MTNKKKILVIQKVHDKGMELINNHPNFDVEVTDDVSIENLKTKIKDCDGASIRIAKLPGVVINEAKNLKIISRHGVGYDNIDLKTAKERDIKIAKRRELYHTTVRDGNFKDRNKLPKTIEVWKKNFLIMGFGRIGKALIKRCLGFEMNVYVYDPFVDKDTIEKLGGKKIDNLEEGVKTMDVISLHMPLTEKTENLINYDLLKTMKQNCIIINAARGGIIHEEDLNRALNEDLIFGAGIDVFKQEPPDNDNPLLKNDKVYLSPHTAAFTDECMTRMGVETIQNIIDYFDDTLEKSKIVRL